MEKKVIYFIFETPILVIYKERCCVNYFSERGWETHMIDLSPILNPIAFDRVITGLVDDSERELFYTKKQYKEYIRQSVDGAVFIIRNNFTYDSYFYHRAIRATQYYGYVGQANTNVEVSNKTVANRLLRLLKNLSAKRIMQSLFIRVPRRLLPVQAAKFIVLGGKENEKLYLNLTCRNSKTVVKYIHSNDYEEYLSIRNKDRIVKEKYCVFLDQYVPYHPDSISAGYIIDAGEYYESMTKLFHYIEEKYLLKVVVAAHPRADYGTQSGVFADFEIIRYKTSELVKDAEFVIAHYSTSISYAALFHKPLLIVMTNDLLKIAEYRIRTERTAELLGREIINVSEESYRQKKVLVDLPDDKKYNNFIRQYIKADYQENNSDIKSFAEQLEELVIAAKEV